MNEGRWKAGIDKQEIILVFTSLENHDYIADKVRQALAEKGQDWISERLK